MTPADKWVVFFVGVAVGWATLAILLVALGEWPKSSGSDRLQGGGRT